MLTQEEYRSYCSRFRRVVGWLRMNSKPSMEVANEICALRGYYPERMLSILEEAGFMYITDESCYSKLINAGEDLALFKDGKFLLAGRYIFPVRDMLGNVVALIGWFPDDKKYVTTPSKLFSKSCLYYGLEQISKVGINKDAILVEGIFDCLSVRSLGLTCYAEMGSTTSRYKTSLYSLFKRVLAIPDNDAVGKSIIQKDSWNLPLNGRYLLWSGNEIKDIDNLCNLYEYEDIKEEILAAFNSKERVYKILL